MSLLSSHPLVWGAVLLLADAAAWHATPTRLQIIRVAVRLALFLAFSTVITNAGISPLQAPSWPDDSVMQLGTTALAIAWWMYAARVLTGLIDLALMPRLGRQGGHLLQDVIGALVFLIGVVAAAGYVLELPVRGLPGDRRGHDHRRPGLAKHVERRVFRDCVEHHQALSG